LTLTAIEDDGGDVDAIQKIAAYARIYWDLEYFDV
jgi:hypothetical protein